MYIGKPFRVIGASCATGAGVAVVFVFLHREIGLWAILLTVIVIPFLYFITEVVISTIDGLLRKWTRDPIWVMQHEQRSKG